jgi:malonate decarboxylase gamma subunit
MAGKTGAERAAMSGLCPSVQVADGELNGESVRFIAVVPDANNHYPRAAKGEVGLLEGWTLAKVVNETIAADANSRETPDCGGDRCPEPGLWPPRRGVRYSPGAGRCRRRLCQSAPGGHPVIGLIVGKAMSGAFLAHGYQANRLIAFNDKGVLVHAMGKASAARITLRTVEALEKLAATIPPWPTTSATTPRSACSPTCWISAIRMPRRCDLALVEITVQNAIADARKDPTLKTVWARKIAVALPWSANGCAPAGKSNIRST